jgi:outer membrane protein
MRIVKPLLSPRILLPLVSILLPFTAHAETLAEVFALAQQNDAVIKAQEANYHAGLETANLAHSALLPQVSLSATHSNARIKDNLYGQIYKTNANTGTLTASQTLFDQSEWYDWQSGKKVGEQAEAQFRSDQQALIVRVVKAYTDVLQAFDAYNTAKAQEAAFGRQLDQTKQRFDVGLVAITDVYDSQASFDSAVVDVVNAKGTVAIAFEALDNITGTPIQSIAPLSDDYVIKNPDPAERDEWVKKALANNSDLQASELAKEAAMQNAEAKRTAYYPTVVASYQHGENVTQVDPANQLIGENQYNDAIAITFNMPLYTGGGVSASRRQALDQYNAADEQYTYVQRSTVQATRSYYLAVTTDVVRVQAQKQAIISAQSALDATKAGYEAGTRNIVEVLLAERALYSAQFLWASARYQYISDILNLKKVAGELSPESIDHSNQFLVADKQIARSEFEN